ncbi:TraE/TraK family type IV conjugative transfer system protein (plasmid) [Glycocaulis abyssi]|jgi:conjugal transfer pilus assembly protein TraE|uniref:TraE/TraK family type IV conjugative transfer system protein n=1 Tax=Glycocaulis abyssi TaxID=1433403 RepID=A0ABV9NI07_9PROT
MKQEAAAKKLRSMTRQLVVSSVLVGALAVGNGMMALALMNTRQDVILVPTLTSDMHVSSGTVSREYLEQVTRDVAGLFLNRHPRNRAYFERAVLRLVHSSVYGDMERRLNEERVNRIETNTSTVFHPVELYTESSQSYSEIHGVLETYVGDERISRENAVFAAEWRLDGLSLRLIEFARIDARDSRLSESRSRRRIVEDDDR